MPPDLDRVALWWGPGVLILLVAAYGGLRLARYWIEKSMEYRRQQMESVSSIARQYVEQFLGGQKAQADAVARLAVSIEQRDTREGFEHQEILITLKAVHHDVERLFQKQ